MNKQEALNAEMRLTEGRQLSRFQTMRLAESVSQMTAQDISSKYSVGMDRANQISQDARMLDSYYKGEAFHDQTQTGGSLSLSGNVGVNGGKSAKVDGDDGKSKLISFSAGGQVGGSLSGGVSATNSDNTGSTKQFNSSEDIAEIQRRFESNVKDISNSNRNDAVTQLARDHIKTLQENESLSNAQAYHESQAQMHLNSYNKSMSISSSDRINLRDSALQVAHERGIDIARASQMIDKYDPRAEEWLKEAKARATLKNTLPPMKQPTPASWSNTKTQIQNSFNKSEQKMRNEMKADSAEIDEQKASLQAQNKAAEKARTSAINSTIDEIEFVGDQIAKNSDSLKDDVAERADRSATGVAVTEILHNLSFGIFRDKKK